MLLDIIGAFCRAKRLAAIHGGQAKARAPVAGSHRKRRQPVSHGAFRMRRRTVAAFARPAERHQL
jgi:hypothetical protein